ncbi:uncharacterized protein si:zfos-911d5.4 isoform X2 [Triplophysa dalaica]|uniref:uncharacterized protein si:zfos-911d5.4 isoform X2 n=1 Tax=Triplophysa dalaica TaxID=1582913 RepID=UPI0024DFCBAC|nr:uncharacterized protein si:zfos-911d5.4 isoform X2 [Triplophysa dalaica]
MFSLCGSLRVSQSLSNGSDMFQMIQLLFSSGLHSHSKTSKSPQTRPDWTHSSQDFLRQVRHLSGLKKQEVFYNLRVPVQCEAVGDEINLVLITGHGVFCMDVKTWSGCVSAQSDIHWLVQVKSKAQISVEQAKARNLHCHMKRCGLNIRTDLFFPRILFLSPDCVLSEELRMKKELVSYADVQEFFCSLRETFTAWLPDVFTPSWISGHLSFRQMRVARECLGVMRTWDLLQLLSGQELKGDYQSCTHLAVQRHETEVLHFSRDTTLLTHTLYNLLGLTTQVTVRMYKRGAEGWLGKHLVATATIPSTTQVIFRISGEESDSQFPVNSIDCVTLSI